MRATTRRSLLLAGAAAAATGLSTGAVAAAGPAPHLHHRRRPLAAPLWTADTARGTDCFEGIETKPGEVAVVDDPKGQYGKVYRLATSGKKIDEATRVRVETRGHKTPDGTRLRFSSGTYYVGWRSLWSELPTKAGDWVVLWQLKDYGTGAATPPLSLRARGDGTVDLEYCDPDLKTTKLWNTPLTLNTWHSFTAGIHISTDPAAGWVQFWHNGARQTLTGGTQQYTCATRRADYVTDKWGVYRSDGVTGPATAYLSGAKVGTSYSAAAVR